MDLHLHNSLVVYPLVIARFQVKNDQYFPGLQYFAD